MNRKAIGYVDGHLVQWDVRQVTWCRVCATRESADHHGLCVRCDADARLLVESAVDAMTHPSGTREPDLEPDLEPGTGGTMEHPLRQGHAWPRRSGR